MIVIVGSPGLLPANGLSAGDDHNSGNAAAKIQQDVQFDRWCSAAKLGQRKSDKQEIDGGRIQRVNSLIEFEPKRLFSIKFSRFRWGLTNVPRFGVEWR